MKKQQVKWVLIGLGLLIAVIVVPIIINECYKAMDGYITKWGGADVLAYYGTIVAAVVGIVGVYFTVYISNKNYRNDARNRVLPYIAISVINVKQPDPFLEGFGSEDYSTMGNDPIIEDSLTGKTQNHLFFVIDGPAKIRATESLPDNEVNKLKKTEVMWIRAARDGKMYLRESNYISMPFTIENIGNGPAKKLRMGFSCSNGKPFFKTEIILKRDERFYIHIFSEKAFEDIKGEYVFSVFYEDIAGNEYEQLFPVEIVEENKNKYKRIDTNGKQRLTGRRNNADA